MTESDFNKIFAENLTYYLELKQSSQAELAKYLNVSATSVTNWCKGLKTPRMDKVDKMCKYFNIKRSDLMNIKTESSNQPFESNAFEIIARKYGDSSKEALELYLQLDGEDRAEIRGEMKGMLRDKKYLIKEGLKIG